MNKKAIRHYLNAQTIMDDNTESLIDECIQEVQSCAEFKATYRCFHLTHQPLMLKEVQCILSSDDLSFYFQDCHECMVIACTLGIAIDRRIKYYEHLNMAKAIVFDAVSNVYLEECCDQYEQTLDLGRYTFRFAPGYGDIPLSLNQTLASLLQIDKKIGVSLISSGLMIPMKSMIGIVGIGLQLKKTCLSCVRKEECELRKGGQRCYVID